MTQTIELAPSPAQWQVFNSGKRFRVLNAGRRFGKTFEAINLEIFPRAVNKPYSTNWYVAPTYRMAKQIAWEALKAVTPPSYILHKDESDLTIILKNRAVMALRGSDNPDSLRGPGLDFFVGDEFAFQDPYVWKVIRPMLSDKGKEGEGLFISTPYGYNHFYDLYMAAKTKPDWEAFSFTTLDGGNVSAEEIESARADLDPRTFRQEYEASFENLTGRVYYAFDRDKNVWEDAVDNPGLDLLVGMDFNVNPMSAALAVRVGGQLHTFDEISIPNGNTDLMAKEIRKRAGASRKVVVYPDPTGKARKTSAPVGQTDFTILRDYGFTVLAPEAPYPQADKINMVNAAMENAAGTRRVFVHPRCKSTIKSLDGLTFKGNTSEPDKKLGLDHAADSIAYLICWEFPIGTRNVPYVASIL